MLARRLALAAGILALVLPAAAAPAHAAPAPDKAVWYVGAYKIDITPPAYNAADDPRDFANCDTTVFSGKRVFDFEEPYVDQNGNGVYDFGEPYCDANANGRWDGIFISGGVGEVATQVPDAANRLYARAFAIGDGRNAVVIASVTAQGLFKNYIDDIRQRAITARPQISGVVVSANHNESSPDTVGIYGAPSLGGAAGGRSGIDDYYMDFLDRQVATAIDKAYDAMQQGSLGVTEVPVPPASIRLSDNFPTTNDNGEGVATDSYARVLQARDDAGNPVFTVMNLAAHNQEFGHSSHYPGQLSEDWPGFFERKLDSDIGGVSIFLVGDNGSIEDPAKDHSGQLSDIVKSGQDFADLVESVLPSLQPLTPNAVRLRTSVFDVPLQNNLFVAAAAAGLFGKRTVDPTGVASGPVALQTEVGVVDVGSDLQMLLWPGETFPALAVGSPWGAEDAPCPGSDVSTSPSAAADRDNPPVPTWHAGAQWRFEVGLADDMLGYLLPPWAFATTPGTTQSTCTTDLNGKDGKGHQHKLEDESVGWAAAGLVASHLTTLLDQDGVVRDAHASIQTGRFVLADGSLSHSPVGAVGLWLTDPQSTTLTPGTGTLIALPGTRGFGTGAAEIKPDAYGEFIDYDGSVQPGGADLATRGMAVTTSDSTVTHRWYADVYPPVTGANLGPADTGVGADLPEAPFAILLPIVGLALAFFIARRRRRD